MPTHKQIWKNNPVTVAHIKQRSPHGALMADDEDDDGGDVACEAPTRPFQQRKQRGETIFAPFSCCTSC